MAEHDTKSEVSISRALRQLKVGYTSIRHECRRTGRTIRYSRCPSLNLKLDWLEEVGFMTGELVTVAVEHGQLIIRALAE
ncbi:SymE family type I addiction module toxin [Pantoea dispersa]|uniref:SymE family type I addiction module toxin n=1 Tax=Pantoea dispersa TaxID=59814 RepID=UPI0028E00D6F|nr:SymE family type I addiction module toxin [Pantoea dispersa]MDT8848920.1 SymE family type I addiction module toxin [Pantoea dispersa]